jgi:hypothetical protein
VKNNDFEAVKSAPCRALLQAVCAKSVEMIWYLAEHGARLERGYVEDLNDIMPKTYEPFLALVVELGAVKD